MDESDRLYWGDRRGVAIVSGDVVSLAGPLLGIEQLLELDYMPHVPGVAHLQQVGHRRRDLSIEERRAADALLQSLKSEGAQ